MEEGQGPAGESGPAEQSACEWYRMHVRLRTQAAARQGRIVGDALRERFNFKVYFLHRPMEYP